MISASDAESGAPTRAILNENSFSSCASSFSSLPGATRTMLTPDLPARPVRPVLMQLREHRQAHVHIMSTQSQSAIEASTIVLWCILLFLQKGLSVAKKGDLISIRGSRSGSGVHLSECMQDICMLYKWHQQLWRDSGHTAAHVPSHEPIPPTSFIKVRGAPDIWKETRSA